MTCCRWFLSSVLVCVWLPGTAIQRRSPVGRYFTLKSSFLLADLYLIYIFCCFHVLCPVFSAFFCCSFLFICLVYASFFCFKMDLLFFCCLCFDFSDAVELSFVYLNTALWSYPLISPVLAVVFSSFRMSTPSISPRTPESSTCRTLCTWRTGTWAALALCFCEHMQPNQTLCLIN